MVSFVNQPLPFNFSSLECARCEMLNATCSYDAITSYVMVYACWFHRHLEYDRAVACSSLKNIDHIHRKKASQNPIIGALCTSKRIQLGIKLPQVEDYNKHDRGKRRDQVSAVVLLHAFCSCCLT